MNQGRIIVITGAPGTGKTTTASVVAKESDLEKSVHMHTDDFYILLKPDGRKVFYLDAIDVMPDYQGKGYGTGLISFARDYAKTIDCYKMYLITNRSNISACKCYEKAGGINKVDDEIIYVYDFKEKN